MSLLPSRTKICQLALGRLSASQTARRYLTSSFEAVVFGSISVGLQRLDSDIDILLVGNHEYRLKHDGLDLIAITTETAQSSIWLQSELASHIAAYGTWIAGTSLWKKDAHVGLEAICNKRRRVIAFLRALGTRWDRLDPAFQHKYSLKLRREVQRLILLERRVPVPATKILDAFWDDVRISPSNVLERLKEFTATARPAFRADLIGRIDTFFQQIVS